MPPFPPCPVQRKRTLLTTVSRYVQSLGVADRQPAVAAAGVIRLVACAGQHSGSAALRRVVQKIRVLLRPFKRAKLAEHAHHETVIVPRSYLLAPVRAVHAALVLNEHVRAQVERVAVLVRRRREPLYLQARHVVHKALDMCADVSHAVRNA